MEVKCPTCRQPTQYATDNPYRPFCSERCQILDLGAWADEKYRVPVNGSVSEGVNENSDGEEDSDQDFPSEFDQN